MCVTGKDGWLDTCLPIDFSAERYCTEKLTIKLVLVRRKRTGLKLGSMYIWV